MRVPVPDLRVLALLALASFSCTTPGTPPPSTSHEDEQRLPAWLKAPLEVRRDAALEEAAALLCARDTDAVIDDDARHASHIADGQVFGLMKKGADAGVVEAALGSDAAALLGQKRATHAGVAVGQSPSGEACAALVGARRLLTARGALPAQVAHGDALALDLVWPESTTMTTDLATRDPNARTAALYVEKPDGFVTRSALSVGCGASDARDCKLIVTVPAPLDGRYIAELVVDYASGPSDPEVALLWPFTVGTPKDPPFPEVLFPDAGHDDIALTHRAEALVQRLRTEEQIEPFKVSPPLVDIADERAKLVAQKGALGHRLLRAGAVASTDAAEDVAAKYGDNPRAQFKRLAEVQAQASTLADAWQALLDSPAHRYVLVDTGYTHCGVAVARGADAAGRATVTMVALLARRPPSRSVDETRATFLETANDARDKRGLTALTESSSLDKTAQRLAGAMRDNRKIDENLLGESVAKVALESDASLNRVKPFVARSDDPLLLLTPPLLMDLDATRFGLGLALDESDGVFYVVVLAGE
ncbi:MAG TPA: CAP domain-containing protein [Myxococcota bacterium]|jgi:uncharacterized protein YkwD